MRPVVLLLVVACSSPPPPPSKPTSASDSAAVRAPAPEVDSGAFAISIRSKVVANETFSFTQRGANVVLRSKNVGVTDPDNNSTDGELELDALHRPVRGAYRTITPADVYNYKLGGTPLTLDVLRDDERDPQHVVATVAVNLYVAGPGIAAMTALCSAVTGDNIFNTIGEKQSLWPRVVEAYRGVLVGALQRVVVDASDYDYELACDGPRLVAGGIAKLDLWFSRAGREADLAALKSAPRPTAHAWKHPVDESEPWDPLHTFLFASDRIIVTRDQRARVNRLTTFSINDGKGLVHRDFTVPLGSHVMCEQLPKARLVCANAATKYLQIVDAKTLADQTDLFPALSAAGSLDDDWNIIDVDDKRLLVDIGSDRAAEIDLDTRNAKLIAIPENRHSRRGPPDPTACPTTLSDPLVVGDTEWSIDQSATSAKLVRKKKKSGAAQPPLELAFYYPSLLRCKPKSGAAFIITHHEAQSVLGVLAPDGSVRWKTELGAHPRDPHIVGETIVMSMSDQARRVLGIDAATGRILWVASGPQPSN